LTIFIRLIVQDRGGNVVALKYLNVWVSQYQMIVILKVLDCMMKKFSLHSVHILWELESLDFIALCFITRVCRMNCCNGWKFWNVLFFSTTFRAARAWSKRV